MNQNKYEDLEKLNRVQFTFNGSLFRHNRVEIPAE